MKVFSSRRTQVRVIETEPEDRAEKTAVEQQLLEMVPAVRVAIGSLVVDDSPRMSGENPDHVQVLVNAQGELPPIIVHRTSMRVLDGMHRVRAAKLRGQDEIDARFFDGDDADAFVVAVRSNITHGLPLSLADRKTAAIRIIASHPQWSDRLLATVTGLAAKTIAEIRRKSDAEEPTTNIRIGLDGRARPVNSTERRKIASKLLIDKPSLSLRTVAKIAGISPETARDVRSRLHQEGVPIAPQQGRLKRRDHVTRDRNRHDHAGVVTKEDLDQVMRQLKSDPTLRYTEAGRVLLRLLNVHAMAGQEWADLCDNVPAHCKATVANMALGFAEHWKRFATRLAEQNKCNT